MFTCIGYRGFNKKNMIRNSASLLFLEIKDFEKGSKFSDQNYAITNNPKLCQRTMSELLCILVKENAQTIVKVFDKLCLMTHGQIVLVFFFSSLVFKTYTSK